MSFTNISKWRSLFPFLLNPHACKGIMVITYLILCLILKYNSPILNKFRRFSFYCSVISFHKKDIAFSIRLRFATSQHVIYVLILFRFIFTFNFFYARIKRSYAYILSNAKFIYKIFPVYVAILGLSSRSTAELKRYLFFMKCGS